MTDIELDRLGTSVVNGGAERALEPKLTVIAKDDALAGRLTIKGSGQVLGTFSGRIDCDGELLIGPDARVEAEVRSLRITIAGFVKGNVVASGRLKITTSGRLEGDARVGALVVQEGGVHHGVIRVHPEGVPESDDHVIVGAATAPSRSAAIVSLKRLPNPVNSVKKFWGEFF
jgi:cytoskeletal protein CcmA (bactofilin family)